MKYIIGICLFLASAVAFAQERYPYPTMTYDTIPQNMFALINYKEVENEAHFGYITLMNLFSVNTDTQSFEIETSRGTVYMQWTSTPNADCTPACPDTATVLGLPENIIAIPSEIVIDENQNGIIYLYEYFGG